MQLVEGDEALVFLVHADDVNLLVDGGFGRELRRNLTHGFAVPDSPVETHELLAVLVDGPHGGEAAVADASGHGFEVLAVGLLGVELLREDGVADVVAGYGEPPEGTGT